MSGSSFLLLLRLGISLAVVMALIWAAARVLKARGGAMQFRGVGATLEVVERRPLGRNSSVALVRVGGQALLVGVTDSRVELLQPCPHLDVDLDVEPFDEISVTELHATTTPTATPVLAPVAALASVGADVGATGAANPNATRRTGSFGAPSSTPTRTSLLDALREVTVRRTTASRPPE